MTRRRTRDVVASGGRPTARHRRVGVPRRRPRAELLKASQLAAEPVGAHAATTRGRSAVQHRVRCQLSQSPGRRSTTASSRPVRSTASPDARWPWKWAVACWRGLESQQPTWPHARHIRRWAHVESPSSAHSWQRRAAGRRLIGVGDRGQVFAPRTGGAGLAGPATGPPHRARLLIESCMLRRDMMRMVSKDRCTASEWRSHNVSAELLAVLVGAVLLSALARRYNVSAPLALVVAGLVVGLIPGIPHDRARPAPGAVRDPAAAAVVGGPGELVCGAAQEHRAIGLLAVGLPLATTFAVGYRRLSHGARADLGRRHWCSARSSRRPTRCRRPRSAAGSGLPRQIMTLLGGESLLNDATALTAYKVALAAAIGTAPAGGTPPGCSPGRSVGGVVVGAGARQADRLRPHLARRFVGRECDRPGGTVRHLPDRRGDPRLRCARGRRRRADPRPALDRRRLRHPPAGRRGVARRAASCWSRSRSC